VISRIDPSFRNCFKGLPKKIQKKAKENYKLWEIEPFNPILRFKQVHPTRPIWSIAIGYRWRALGLKNDNMISWFWIGSHEDYNNIIN